MCKPKDMLVAFIGAFIGITVVEFTLGWLLMDFFKANNPLTDAAAGMAHLFGYIIGSAIIFGAIFALLVANMRVRKHWFKGVKVGILYGLIASLPWVMMAFFLATYDFTYLTVSTVYVLIEYAVAGLVAMVLLKKFGTKK